MNYPTYKLVEVIDKVAITSKVKQKEYLADGKFPIIDQGQDLIGGYSNDEKQLVNAELPVIVFGDHTKVKKYIDFPFVAGADGTKIIKPKKDFFIEQKLFYWFLHCVKFPDKGYARHFQYLLKSDIAVPPLPTQCAIVTRIETLFAELDKGVEKLKNAQQQLKAYRQAVLNDCLTKGSEKWEKVKLGDVLSVNNEKYNPIKEEYIFYIGLEHILKNEGKLVDHIGKELIKTLKNKFYKGQILYGKLRPNLNKIYLTDKEGVCSTDILVLDVKEEIEAKFIFYNMFCQRFVNKMSANTNGVNLPRVPTKFILEYPIFLPSLSTQQRIVQEIETRLSQVELVEASVEQSLQQAEALRQSILKKAFSGELV